MAPAGAAVISAPGAAMLDSKLFVSRLDGPFRDLYERFWDGEEWIWVDHGRPQGVPVTGTPGAAMLNDKLFVVVEDGSLWERDWRPDLGAWAWENHGRPANRRIVAGPGAAMMNSKLFVVVDDGRLWERHWRPDLGQWAWEDHGRPPATDARTAPGAAMLNSKLFVGAGDGRLFERFWNGSAWVWVDHGRPPGTRMRTDPGAEMQNRRLFVGADDGRLFERLWDGSAWVWADHGRPTGTRVATAPGAAMMGSKLFVGTENGHLFERFFTGAEWVWVDHGTARHDDAQHVIGAPGTDRKLTIAILGDGYDEATLGDYRSLVERDVLGALRLDPIGAHQGALRVVRIDVLSPGPGITERRYDTKGTQTIADDEVVSEDFRFSRLGVIATAEWSHCWFDRSSFTDARIGKLGRRFAPEADHLIVMVNTSTYGGCSSVGPGIGLFSSSAGREVIAHELGHNLFELDDEYVVADGQTFTSTSTRANTTERLADWSTLKWSALVTPGTPLPTDPANLPPNWNRRTSVGAFEGAGGSFSRGLFRPVLECRMNQNDPPWCPVCGRKITGDLAVFE